MEINFNGKWFEIQASAIQLAALESRWHFRRMNVKVEECLRTIHNLALAGF